MLLILTATLLFPFVCLFFDVFKPESKKQDNQELNNEEVRLKKLEEENSPLEIKVDYDGMFKKGNEQEAQRNETGA